MDGMVLPDDTPTPGPGRVRRGQPAGDLRPRRRGDRGHQPLAHRSTTGTCGSWPAGGGRPDDGRAAAGRCRSPSRAARPRWPSRASLAAGRSGRRDLADRAGRAGRRRGVGAGRARGGARTVPAPVRAGRAASRPGSSAPVRRSGRPARSTRRAGDLRRPDRPAASLHGLRGRRAAAGAVAGADRQRPRSACAARTSWRRRRRPAARGRPGRPRSERWRERGLDRLVHRVLESTSGRTGLVVRVRVSAANSGLFVDIAYSWRLADDLGAAGGGRPVPGWDCTWPRVGVRFDLPGDLDRGAAGSAPGRTSPTRTPGGPPGGPVLGAASTS